LLIGLVGVNMYAHFIGRRLYKSFGEPLPDDIEINNRLLYTNQNIDIRNVLFKIIKYTGELPEGPESRIHKKRLFEAYNYKNQTFKITTVFGIISIFSFAFSMGLILVLA